MGWASGLTDWGGVGWCWLAVRSIGTVIGFGWDDRCAVSGPQIDALDPDEYELLKPAEAKKAGVEEIKDKAKRKAAVAKIRKQAAAAAAAATAAAKKKKR